MPWRLFNRVPSGSQRYFSKSSGSFKHGVVRASSSSALLQLLIVMDMRAKEDDDGGVPRVSESCRDQKRLCGWQAHEAQTVRLPLSPSTSETVSARTSVALRPACSIS